MMMMMMMMINMMINMMTMMMMIMVFLRIGIHNFNNDVDQYDDDIGQCPCHPLCLRPVITGFKQCDKTQRNC